MASTPLRKSDQPCSVDGCQNTQGAKGARGLCSKHYQRRLATGSPTGSRRPSAESRFFPKVAETADGCWLWTATKDQNGYGMFAGRTGVTRHIRAHIWAYQFFIGAVPDGLQLDHLCRKPSCVNPWHLEPVPPRINTLRGLAPSALNAVKTKCKRGHDFDTTNTYNRPGDGSRVCRKCMDLHRTNYDHRKKVA